MMTAIKLLILHLTLSSVYGKVVTCFEALSNGYGKVTTHFEAPSYGYGKVATHSEALGNGYQNEKEITGPVGHRMKRKM